MRSSVRTKVLGSDLKHFSDLTIFSIIFFVISQKNYIK